ncbi:MAG: helix-turn-helix domain-containing protein [Pseudomonadota bacterium]
MSNRIDIKFIREALGLSFEGLGERIGVHRTTVNRWENGRSEPKGAARKLLENLQREAEARAPEGEAA